MEKANTARTAARAEGQRLAAQLAGLKKEQRRLERCKAEATEEPEVNGLVWKINELVEEINQISETHANASAALQEADNRVSFYMTALDHNHDYFVHVRMLDASQGALLA